MINDKVLIYVFNFFLDTFGIQNVYILNEEKFLDFELYSFKISKIYHSLNNFIEILRLNMNKNK